MKFVTKIVFVILPLILIGCDHVPQPGNSSGGGDGGEGVHLKLDGGTHVGSGSEDENLATRAAWFQGRFRIVRVCFYTRPDFGARSYIQYKLQKAIDTWVKYMKDNRIHETLHPNAQIARDYRVSSEKCGYQHDLFVYFGDFGELDALRQTYPQHDAYAHRIGRRGIIAIRKRTHWYSHLLHEFGHVLGNQHSKGNIMDNDLIKRVDLDKIDYTRSLVACTYCTFKLNSEKVEKMNDFLTEYTGIPPKGIPEMTVFRSGGNYLIEVRNDISRVELTPQWVLKRNQRGEINVSKNNVTQEWGKAFVTTHYNKLHYYKSWGKIMKWRHFSKKTDTHFDFELRDNAYLGIDVDRAQRPNSFIEFDANASHPSLGFVDYEFFLDPNNPTALSQSMALF